MSQPSQTLIKLPILDISKTQSPSSLSSLLQEACKQWGFFHIINHGVSDEILTKLSSFSKQIFSLPLDTKLNLGPSSSSRSYTPHFIASPFYEGLKVSGPDLFSSAQCSANLLFGPNNHDFSDTVQEYGDKMTSLCNSIVKTLLSILGNDFENKFYNTEFSKCYGYLRIIQYTSPPAPDPEIPLSHQYNNNPSNSSVTPTPPNPEIPLPHQYNNTPSNSSVLPAPPNPEILLSHQHNNNPSNSSVTPTLPNPEIPLSHQYNNTPSNLSIIPAPPNPEIPLSHQHNNNPSNSSVSAPDPEFPLSHQYNNNPSNSSVTPAPPNPEIPLPHQHNNNPSNSSVSEEREVEGLGKHTDMCCLTILYSDDSSSLQVRSKEGEWMNIEPCEGSLVVNLGDMLEAWSNGKLRSSEHRVMLNKRRNRVCLAFFWSFEDDKVIFAPKEVVGEGNRREFRSFVCSDYVRFREFDDREKYEKVGETVRDFAGI